MRAAKMCRGWSRYNSGQHVRCDRPATGPDGYCDLHLHVARTDPFGTGATKRPSALRRLEEE